MGQIDVRAHFGLAKPSQPPWLEALWGSGAAPAALAPPAPVLRGSCCCKVWGPTSPSASQASPAQPSILAWLCFGGVLLILNSKPATNPFSQPSPCSLSRGAGHSIPAASPGCPPSFGPPRCPVCTQGCTQRLFTCCTCHLPFYTNMYRGKTVFDGEKANATAKKQQQGKLMRACVCKNIF